MPIVQMILLVVLLALLIRLPVPSTGRPIIDTLLCLVVIVVIVLALLARF